MADLQQLLDEVNELSHGELATLANFINRRLQLVQIGLDDIGDMPDEEVLALADAKMTGDQQARLHILLEKGGEAALSLQENDELDALMDEYEDLLLRKSQALAEAVQRGLRPPLSN